MQIMGDPFYLMMGLFVLLALAAALFSPGTNAKGHSRTPYRPPKYDLKDMVSRITSENKHDFHETDFGGPVGREKL
jgi:hypothetical protein